MKPIPSKFNSPEALRESISVGHALTILARSDADMYYNYGVTLPDLLSRLASASTGTFVSSLFGHDGLTKLFALPEVRSHLWSWYSGLRPTDVEVSRLRDDLSLSFARYHELYMMLARAQLPWLPPRASIENVHAALNVAARSRFNIHVTYEDGVIVGCRASVRDMLSCMLEYASLYGDTTKSPVPHSFASATNPVRNLFFFFFFFFFPVFP
jgi:hypothetical protein